MVLTRVMKTGPGVSVVGTLAIMCLGIGSTGCSDDAPASETTVDAGSGDALADAGDITADEVSLEPPGTVRFVHISDSHVHGPPEAPSAGHLERAVEKLNEVDFDAHFLVATGDSVDFLPDGLDQSVETPLHVAIDTLSEVQWPINVVVGNHEYYQNDQLWPTEDKEAREAYLADVYDRPLDYSFVEQGVRFVALNSMAGDLWRDNAGLVGSFTDAQISWLRDEVADGRPTILFFHHPPVPGVTTESGDSLCRVVEDNPGTFKGVFAGHLHGFWQGDFCGIPYYLVANVDPNKVFYFLVQYESETDTLTIVNEEDVSFGDLPEVECEPEATTLDHPNGAVSTHQILRVGTMVSNLPGLEGFEGDALNDFPFVLHVDAWNEAAATYDMRFTMGVTESGYVEYVQGAPCVAMTVDADGACVVSESVSLSLDIAPILGTVLDEPLDPSWQVRIDVESLWFEAEMAETDGTPTIEAGVLHLNGSGTGAIDDLKMILIDEYCAGNITGCEPGSSDTYPACDADRSVSFFDEIPERCDIEIAGYPLRFLFMFVASYPLDNIVIAGEFHTEVIEASEEPQADFVDTHLFSTDGQMNCAP